MSYTQHAYCKNKSTTDVVLAHKLLIGGSIEREMSTTVVGIDMSAAFDTVIRHKLLNILLLQDIIEPEELQLIKFLLAGTTLAVKVGKKIGDKFPTNI